MKHFLTIALSCALLTSCEETPKEAPGSDDVIEIDQDQFLPIEKRAKRHVMNALGIAANEKFSYKIWKKEMNGDGKEDAVITVNRLEFAMQSAEKSSNSAKLAEIGFMGNYNYFFYFDGSSRKITGPTNVPSTPQHELDVRFEHITSEDYFDFIVDLRIRNSCFSDFYTVQGTIPSSIFYWKRFDGIGTETIEAYDFKFAEGSTGERKNILVMKANLKLPEGDFDPYTVDPVIESNGEVLHTFFYVPQKHTYMTKK